MLKNCVKVALLAVSTLTLAAGCGNQKEISYSSGGMTQTFSQGQNLPKDFALPVYPGATTSGSVAGNGDDEETQFLMLTTPDTIDKVSEFYEDKLKATGWTVDSVQPQAKVTAIDAHKDKISANIEIAEDIGKTTVSLSWGKPAENIQDVGENASENYKPDKVTPPTD